MSEVSAQARAARHLTAIVAMYPDLIEQAAARSTDGQPGSDRILGGDAMVLLSPGANLTAYKFRMMSTLMGRIDAAQEQTSGDPDPVIQVLAYWDDELRAERGEPTDLPATVKRSSDYIRATLDWAFSDAAEEFDADQMVSELGRLRSRMEAVLKQGHRPDRTQVPCIEGCDARLNKEWHDHAKWDGYRCPECRRFYDQDAFIRARAQQLESQGADRYVRKQDAIEATPRPAETVRKWIEGGKVQTRKDASGNSWVWWPDVRKLHLDTPTRARGKGA